MLFDLKFIVFWWLEILVLGLILLPLTVNLFGRFWDKGYIFSKTISMFLITYVFFVLSVLKILPFTNISIFFVAAFILVLELILLKKTVGIDQTLKIIQKNKSKFVLEEILFFVVLLLWSYVRGFAPNIEGLEKFMDWGFVNSSLRSSYMPPNDMWFAGQPINYYYFGHLVFAMLTKISALNSAITYNLSIATVCALTFVGGFSISSNMIYLFFKKSKPKLFLTASLISALLLTFGGNLHSVYKIAKLNIKNEGRLVLTSQAIKRAANVYWYPDATRFIGHDPDTNDKTIHEFPSYSFVVSDLHGHMNDIPIVLLFMALLLTVSLTNTVLSSLKLVLPLSLTLSVAYMTNAWDFAVYGILFAVFFFLNSLKKNNFWDSVLSTLINGGLIIILWYIFTLPFSLHFTPMAEGLRLSDTHTPFYQLFVLYGGFWLMVVPFVIYLIYQYFFKKQKANLEVSEIFALSLIVVATLLIIIPEIGYIKDIYIFEHRRANTMFKLVYESFIMYSVVSGFVFLVLWSKTKNLLLRYSYFLIFVSVFVAHLIYPYFAIKSYYGLTAYKGLWGLDFLQTAYPDSLQAIDWLNKNVSGSPTIAEAVGDSYTTYNHISSATGLPTIEGWIVHEWLWRGGYDQPAARQEDVKKIYESANVSEVKSLLQKYNVKYIIVGDKEHEKYPQLNDSKFESVGAKEVVRFGNTKILEVVST